MFTVEMTGDNRIDIEFSGKLDSAEMNVAIDELINKSSDIENGLMLYRVGEFNLPTLGAIGIELSRLPELFGMIRKFRRAAVLADKKWIQTISEIEGALFPGLEIKAFDLDQEAEAEVWLAG